MPAEPAPRRSLDANALAGDLERILVVLHNSGAVRGACWLSAGEVSRILREHHGIRVHWRTIDSILGRARETADRRKRQRRWQYTLLSCGENLVTKPQEPIVLVDPTQAVQAVLSLHAFLSDLRGTARVCDPYIDAVTIEHLDSCPRSTKIFLLTKNVADSGKMRRLLSAAKTSGLDLSIRRASKAPLHDRYILDDRSLLILGTSLNGFGKKQCFVIRAGQDLRKLALVGFQRAWFAASRWPQPGPQQPNAMSNL